MRLKILNLKVRFFLSVLVTLIAIGGFGHYYLTRLESLFTTEVEAALVERAVQTAESLHHILDTRISLLITLSELPVMRDRTLPISQKLQTLAPMVSRHGLIRFGISDLQGQALTTDGHVMDISQREYFLTGIKGTSNISRLLTCYILDIPIIVYTTPLYDAQGKVYGVFFATENTRIFTQLLQSTQLLNTKGAAMLITASGDILDGSEPSPQRNIFADLLKENTAEAVSVLQQGTKAKQTSQAQLSLDTIPNYIVTTPIRGTPEWNLLTITSEDVFMGKTKEVLNITVYTLLLVAGCILFVMLYISKLQRRYAGQKGMTSIAIESAGLYYITVDAQGNIFTANDYFITQAGLNKAQFPGLSLHSISLHITQDELALLLEQEDPFELQIHTSGDDTIYVQWTPMPDSGGENFNLLGTDLTLQRKIDQEQRSHMEQRNLQMVFDNVPVPLALRNLTDAVIMCNSALRTLANQCSDREILDASFPEVLPYENYPVLHNALEEAFAHSAPVTVEHSLLYPDGSRHYFRTTQVPLYDENAVPSSVLTVFIDITHSKNMQENLVKEVNRLQNLLETSPIAVAISVQGKIRFLNLCAKKMIAVSEGDATRSIFDGADIYDHVLAEIHNNNVVPQIEARLFNSEGIPHDLLINVAPTQYRGELGAIAWAVDVTELKNIEKELMAARDAAEAATHAKSEFLTNMSHEIRTPMNAILGMNHLVLQTELTTKQQDYLKKIDISAKSLLRILNDILDFSKIDTGQLNIEYTDFRLDTLLNDCLDLIGVKAREKALKLHLRIENNVPLWVQGDVVRLGQIVQNLLNNAVKFTEKGSVAITVGLRESTPHEYLLQFSIRDTGVGMSEEQTAIIFQSFTQGDASTTRKYGGTGLGLAISKKLVELMHGHIQATSTQGQGTTFLFTVRLKRAQYMQPQILTTPTPLSSFKGLHVLLVEDNAINQEVAQAILQAADIEVDIAGNGQEALECVRNNHYDAVLIDIQMPVMDGITATRLLRENPQLQDLPIIAMTAHAMTSDKEKALNAGMNDYVTKPIDPEILYATLRRWLPMVSPAVLHSFPAPPVAEHPEHIVGIDKNAALSRLLGNEKLLTRLLTDFYAKFTHSVEELRQKLKPTAPLNVENYEGCLLLSHTIKGVAANLAMHNICGAATKLEALLKANPPVAMPHASSPLSHLQYEQLTAALDTLEQALHPTLESIAANILTPASTCPPHGICHTGSGQTFATTASRLAHLSVEQQDEAIASLRNTQSLLALNDPEAEVAFTPAHNFLGDTFTEEVQNVLLALDNFDFATANEHLKTLLDALSKVRNIS